MAHPGDNILYMDITGLDEPLGVTDTHPIWSETRQDFVLADQLKVGEQFRTLNGESATLTKIHPHRGPPQMVFNLEVDGEHVYTVAGHGLLVHNTCVDDDMIRAAMQQTDLSPTQGAVSRSLIQKYVDKLGGSAAPNIQVDGSAIVDGHHRELAGQIFGQVPGRDEWLLPPSTEIGDWLNVVIY